MVTVVTKSNPSKRHRERLNGELDRLANILPFTENVLTRLDKLSVLRLSVGFLKVKSFFNATMKKNGVEFHSGNGLDTSKMNDVGFSEGELLLQALDGFVLVVTAEGYVFYASSTVHDYLGFHQSDLVHQSVFEFIHVDDRAMFRRQLHFALKPNRSDGEAEDAQNSSEIMRNVVSYDPQHVPPENSSFLERSFVCRFRCLLDNSSGFLNLNFQGRLKFLLGQNRKEADGSVVQPQLALFAIATPVPSAILEIRTKTIIFQTKHKLDFTPMGIDSRGRVVLGYTEIELCSKGSGYQFIHAADMMHCADSHVRIIKTGESGMTVFRLLTKNGDWVWVQSNARLVYKAGRPDFIVARQRALVNAEGEEHLRQRSLQLPFSFTTGEAVLYNTSPALDMTSTNATNKVSQKLSAPGSLLFSMQTQDRSIYQQKTEAQFSPEDAFADSWALFNVPNCPAQVKSTSDEDTVESVIEALEQMTQGGDLCTALQQTDVDTAKLNEWEAAILSYGNDRFLGLDEILTNDIFSYVDDALHKENYPATVQTAYEFNSKEITGHLHRPDTTLGNNVPWFTDISSQNTVNNCSVLDQTSLSACASKVTQNQSGLKVTQSVYSVAPRWGWGPETPIENGSTPKLESTESNRRFGSSSTISANDSQMNHTTNHFHKPTQNLCNHMSTGNQNPPTFPFTKICTSPTMNFTSLAKLHQLNEIQARRNASSEQPCASLVRLASDGCYQTPENSSNRLPEISQNCNNNKHGNFVDNFYKSPENRDAVNQHSSYMLENRSPLDRSAVQQHPELYAVAISTCCKSNLPINQSPPQASCYFQWTCSEPLVGTSLTSQRDTFIRPPSCQIGPNIIAPLDGHSVFQRYLGCNGHI